MASPNFCCFRVTQGENGVGWILLIVGFTVLFLNFLIGLLVIAAGVAMIAASGRSKRGEKLQRELLTEVRAMRRLGAHENERSELQKSIAPLVALAVLLVAITASYFGLR